MNIVVLGGAGDMGSHIVRDLIEHSDAEVTIADYQVSKAQALAHRLGERVRSTFVDAGNRDSLLLVLRDADVAVGAVGPFYRFAPKMAWAAIESHVDYVDICDDYGPIETLFEFDAVARREGVTLVTGLGWTPGLSNVLARHGANQMDHADEIRIAWVGGAADSQGLAVVQHVLYALSGRVPTYREGRWVKVPALSEPEVVTFPEPLGEIEVFHVGHPEPMTIPRTIPVWAVSLKGALTPRWNNRLAALLVRLGLTSTLGRIDRMSRLIHRLEGVLGAGGVALSGLRVDVIGTRDGEQLTKTYMAADHMGRLTGVPAAVGALMLARGEIEQPGVFAPEAIIEPEPFLDALAERGITIVEEEVMAPEAVAEEEPPAVAVVGAGEEQMVRGAAGVPSARLTLDEVVQVVLDLDRGRPTGAGDEGVPARRGAPAGVLRSGQVVEVVLGLDQDRPMPSAATASPEGPPVVAEAVISSGGMPMTEGQGSVSPSADREGDTTEEK